MTPERYQHLKSVLHEAMAVRPEERSGVLDQTCSTDPELRKEVESLLAAADEGASDLLSSSIFRVSLAIGTRLGDYEVQSQIAAGGMGEVYRAHDCRLDRDVAIKVLPSFLASDRERLRRFEQEARAAAALNHPNILAVLQMGTHEGAPYLVTELLAGATLRQELQRGALPIRKAIDYSMQIANGLAAAHEQGIIHRDLKPENLFINKEGHIKILDFGLAKLTHDKATPRPATPDQQTEPGMVMGTVGYMAPEQVRAEPVDHRADIFSFGAVLYEMLSGKRAFHAATAAETLGAILKDDPIALADAFPEIPPHLQRVVQRCLEKAPGQRFQSARDLAFAVESLAESGSWSAVSSRKAGVPLRWIWAALVVIIAALGMVYFTRSRMPARAMHFSIVLPSSVRDLALSPDGRVLAFVAPRQDGGGNVLWIREVGSTEMHFLENTDGASYPFWSPDALSIAFFADAKLKTIPVTGGPSQILCDASFGRGGTWNADGTILFAPSPGGGLARVPATGGSPTPVTETPSASAHYTNLSHRWPSFLPDGKHFLYTMVDFTDLRSSANAIYVGALGSKEQRRLVISNSNAAYVDPGYLLFVKNGILVAQQFDAGRLELRGETFAVGNDVEYQTTVARSVFSASANGTMLYQTGSGQLSQLEWFDRSGKSLSIVGKAAHYANPRLSPDGHKVAVDIDDPDSNSDIWLINVESGARSRFSFDPALDETPIWSPDGATVIWVSQRGGGINLWLKSTTGTAAERPIWLSPSRFLYLPTDWFSNGSFLLLEATRQDWLLQMWILSMRGEATMRPFMPSQAAEKEGQFSPDGHWVAYSSNESGRWQVYVAPFPGPGTKYQISTSGGQQPRWRRDGKELYFLSPDKKLMAVAVKSTFDFGPATTLFQTRAHEPLSAEEVFTYDVSRDGRRFLINADMEQAHPQSINIVLNWTSELRK